MREERIITTVDCVFKIIKAFNITMGNSCGQQGAEYACPLMVGFHPFESEEKVNSRKIDAEIKEYYESNSKIIKVLLLGPGESGKSTIIKQIKRIHCQGATNFFCLKRQLDIF